MDQKLEYTEAISLPSEWELLLILDFVSEVAFCSYKDWSMHQPEIHSTSPQRTKGVVLSPHHFSDTYRGHALFHVGVDSKYHLQCFQLSPSIFLFPYVRKVFDLPKFTDTLVSYLPGSGLGQYQLIDSQATFSNAKAAILVTSQAQL